MLENVPEIVSKDPPFHSFHRRDTRAQSKDFQVV